MPVPLLLAAALVVGVTDNPCTADVAVPAQLEAWQKAAYAPGNRKMPPPPPEVLAYAAAYKEARKTDWPDLCQFRADNARLAALPPAERDVVFMGDSITRGWLYGDPALFGRGWIDRGISGQTTPQMLLRFPADVLALHPRAVHIMAGTNDIAGNTGPTTLDTIESNIAAMVTLAKAAGIRVVLAATPPSIAFGWAPQIKPSPQIAALDQRLRALAAREHVTFIDYAPVLATPDGAMRPELSFDGVHPDPDGYAAMRPLARKAIAEALR